MPLLFAETMLKSCKNKILIGKYQTKKMFKKDNF